MKNKPTVPINPALCKGVSKYVGGNGFVCWDPAQFTGDLKVELTVKSATTLIMGIINNDGKEGASGSNSLFISGLLIARS